MQNKVFVFIAISSITFLMGIQSVLAETTTVRIYSMSGDGDVSTSPYPGSWDQQYQSVEGRLVSDSDDIIRVQTAANISSRGYLAIARGFVAFDLGFLPSNATITSAEVGLFVSNKLDDFDDEFGYIQLSQGKQASANSLLSSDISKCGDSIENPSPLSERIDVTSIAVDSYQVFSLLDAQPLVDSSNQIKLCIREGHDIENKEVVNNDRSWRESRIYVNSSENPATNTRPYLEITYVSDETPDRDGLYTQVESPYPSQAETATWASDAYAAGDNYVCGSTIAACGCVLTSLVMGGRDAGITENVLGGDVNPGTMNEYLQSVNGYTSNGALKWLAASAYFGEFQSDGTLATRFSGAPKRPGDQAVMSFIASSTAIGNNLVLAYQGGHYVWVPEVEDGEYVVYDPWWYNTLTADDVRTPTSTNVKDYNNAFTDARVLALSDTPRVFSGSDVEAHLVSDTAELLFTNAAGQVGYVAGGVLVDLQNATYGNTEIIALDGVPADTTAGKHLLVYEAGDQFTIEVVGTAVGEYEFEFFTIDEFGETQSFTAVGQTLPGISTTFTFDLETGRITEEPISKADVLALLDLVLEDQTKQQRAFFVRWMERYYGKLDQRTVSQTLQQIEVLRTLFTAKQVEHTLAPTVIDILLAGTTTE